MAGRPSKRQDRIDRDERILSAEARGEPHALIARREGVSQRTVSRVLHDAHDAERATDAPAPTLVEVDPFALAAEVIDSTQASLRELRLLAARTANPSARVGALKAVPQAGASLLDVLARVGLAPSVPVEWWSAREWERARGALVEVAEEHGIDAAELQDAMNRRLDQAFARGGELRVVGDTFESSAA